MQSQDASVLDISSCEGRGDVVKDIAGWPRPASMFDFVTIRIGSPDLLQYEEGLNGVLLMFAKRILAWKLPGFGATHLALVHWNKQRLNFLESEFTIDITSASVQVNGVDPFSIGIARPEEVRVASLDTLKRRWEKHVELVSSDVQALVDGLPPLQRGTYDTWEKRARLATRAFELAAQALAGFEKPKYSGRPTARDTASSAAQRIGDVSGRVDTTASMVNAAHDAATSGDLVWALDLMQSEFAVIEQEFSCIKQVRAVRALLVLDRVAIRVPAAIKDELFHDPEGEKKVAEAIGNGTTGGDGEIEPALTISAEVAERHAAALEAEDDFQGSVIHGVSYNEPPLPTDPEVWERRAAALDAADDFQGLIANGGLEQSVAALDQALAREAEREKKTRSSRAVTHETNPDIDADGSGYLSRWERQQAEDDFEAELYHAYLDGLATEIYREGEVRGS